MVKKYKKYFLCQGLLMVMVIEQKRVFYGMIIEKKIYGYGY